MTWPGEKSWGWVIAFAVGAFVSMYCWVLMVTDTPRTYEPQRWTPQTSGQPVETEVFP